MAVRDGLMTQDEVNVTQAWRREVMGRGEMYDAAFSKCGIIGASDALSAIILHLGNVCRIMMAREATSAPERNQ